DDHCHHAGDGHDLQRPAARLVNAADVLPEEEGGDGAGDQHGAAVHGTRLDVRGDGDARQPGQRVEAEADDVLAGRDAADRPRQDVVEHQGRAGQLGRDAAEGGAHHLVDAAADEERAALDVDHADEVTEGHHAEDEPGGNRPDGVLDDAADVVGGGGEVAQD